MSSPLTIGRNEGRRNMGPLDEEKMLELMAKAGQVAGDNVKTEVLAAATAILGDNNSLNVTKVPKTQLGGSRPITDLPEIDDYDPKASSSADLERVMLILTHEDQETQGKVSKERIQSLLKQLEAAHKNVLEKLKKALEKAVEAAKAMKRAGIFGWIMKIIMAIAMVAMAILTVGTGSALAIAGLTAACLAAGLSVTETVLDATGVKEKHIKKKAEEIRKKNPQMSLAEATAKAEGMWSLGFGITGAVLSLASIGLGIASLVKGGAEKAVEAGVKEGVKAAEKAVEESARQGANLAAKGVTEGVNAAAKGVSEGVKQGLKQAIVEFCKKSNVQFIAKFTSITTSVLNTAGGAVSVGFSFADASTMKELAKRQALLKLEQAILQRIEEQLDEAEEKLKEMLVKLQNGFGAMADILESETNTSNLIGQRMTFGV